MSRSAGIPDVLLQAGQDTRLLKHSLTNYQAILAGDFLPRELNYPALAGLTSIGAATTLGRKLGGNLAQMSRNWPRYLIGLGAVFGLLSVVAGALGVHALRDTLEPGALNTFQTASRFQMYHALALVLTGLLADRWPSRMLVAAGWLYTAGVVFFCGSLYILALTGIGVFGAVAPFGGASLMSGWGLLALSVFTRAVSRSKGG